MATKVPSPGKEWKENTGTMPKHLANKRVRVVLNHGEEPAYDNRWQPMSPPGWAAKSANWSLDDSYPFAIAWYLPL